MVRRLHTLSGLACSPFFVSTDPYYYLQYDPMDFDDTMSDAPFQFIPSFLSMDVDGRVMRVDRSVFFHTPIVETLRWLTSSFSFSKIMAPGMRLGWITSNPVFHEMLVHLTDSSTHHPHAFGQIFITEMLSSAGWQLAGFDRWIRSLRLEYQRRRDVFMRAFLRDVASTGFAHADFPEAGMFVWIKVDIERHPRYRRGVQAQGSDASGARTNVAQLMEELFERCLDGGLVVMPASIFATPVDAKVSCIEDPIEDVSV